MNRDLRRALKRHQREVVANLATPKRSLPDLQRDFSAEEWELNSIEGSFAEYWITRYHYSHCAPAGSRYWAAYAPHLVCIVGVGLSANCYGIEKKFELQKWKGNLEITRVAAHPEAPFNTPTRVVAMVLAELRAEGVEWVFSYADIGQDHHGGIYQGLNALYLGISGSRPGYLLNGEKIHPRSVVAKYGTQGYGVFELAQVRGERLERHEKLITAKHTYLLPCGSPASRRAIRKHLEKWSLPYPTRADHLTPWRKRAYR